MRLNAVADPLEEIFADRALAGGVAGGIEGDVLLVGGEQDVGGIAVRLGEIFGLGPDDGALDLTGVNIEHVIRAIDDAGLNHDDEFLPGGFLGGGAEEMFDEGNLGDEGEAGHILGFGLRDAAADGEDGSVGDGNFIIEGLSQDVGDLIAVDQGGAGDGVVDLIDLDGDFVLGVDEGADFQHEFDVFILDIGGD